MAYTAQRAKELADTVLVSEIVTNTIDSAVHNGKYECSLYAWDVTEKDIKWLVNNGFKHKVEGTTLMVSWEDEPSWERTKIVFPYYNL